MSNKQLAATQSSFLSKVTNSGTQQAYTHALHHFLMWYEMWHEGTTFDCDVIKIYLQHDHTQKLSRSYRNIILSALKGLALELYHSRQITHETQALIQDLKLERQQNLKTGNWLTEKQVDDLLGLPDKSLHGMRDQVIFACLIGCGLRRVELSNLRIADIGWHRDRWGLTIKGKPNSKLWLVSLPTGVKQVIDKWLDMRGCLATGGDRTNLAPDTYILCPVMQGDIIINRRLSVDSIYDVVREYGIKLGIPTLAPHDLRRTFARLMKDAGADSNQIRMELGHYL